MRSQPVRGEEEVAANALRGRPGRWSGRAASVRAAAPMTAIEAVPAPGAGAPIAPPDLTQLPRARLAAMLAAGREALECVRVLEKAERNVVVEALRGHGTFYEHEHYPPDDVYDRETHSQYYYHAHRGLPGEHGHFHTFLRAAGMPRGAKPVPHSGAEPWPQGDDALSHLVAISMDAYGKPIGLFTANRWVTGDTWYPARSVARMLDRFAIDHAAPSWPTNRWLTAMFRLFRPHMTALLQRRDAVVAAWAAAHPGTDVYEDRRLEVASWLLISVDEEVERLRLALNFDRRIQ